MARKLASIKQVKDLKPIENRDRIELAIIDGWQVIVKKDEFKIGDKVIYIEVDSILPEKEEFEFLRKKKFRIKTMKMAGTLSQGICFPLSVLSNDPGKYTLEQEVTEELGITKYDPEALKERTQRNKGQKKPKNPILKFLFRFNFIRNLFFFDSRNLGRFPSFISKTDEIRIQNIPRILEDKSIKYDATEKIDGQSATFFLKKVKHPLPFFKDKLEFGVCSRNFELQYGENNNYWLVAKKYNIKELLLKLIGDSDFIAIQGEQIGPGIQGNKYKVNDLQFYIFNIIDDTGKKNPYHSKYDFILSKSGIPLVPLIATNIELPDSVNELLEMADGKSELNDKILREGLVFRNYDSNVSFKAISPAFEIKYD